MGKREWLRCSLHRKMGAKRTHSRNGTEVKVFCNIVRFIPLLTLMKDSAIADHIQHLEDQEMDALLSFLDRNGNLNTEPAQTAQQEGASADFYSNDEEYDHV